MQYIYNRVILTYVVEFIGAGERATLKILREIFGNTAEYIIQYKFKDLLTPEYDLSERQEKETLDIVVKLPSKTIVVRVQDKHHTGAVTSIKDIVQRKTLEMCDICVVDIWFYECPKLWTDVLNDGSRNEVKTILKSAGLVQYI